MTLPSFVKEFITTMSYSISIRRRLCQLSLLWSLLLLTACSSAPEPAPEEETPAKVSVLTLQSGPEILTSELPGRVSAFRSAEVRPQVSGIVVRRLFEEGADVTAGQLLYQIDDASYRAVVARAEAGLAVAEASLVNLNISVERYRQLVDSEGVSQHEYELALASYQQGVAEVKAARAEVDAARIDLERTGIRSPIDGRIGRSLISEGALVVVGQNEPLATVRQSDPVYVDIVQSSRDQVSIRRRLASGELLSGSQQVRLTLEDGSAYPLAGELKLTEMNVDADTGVVTMRAQFANPQGLLLPGMYVRTRVEQGVAPALYRIPQQAVRYNERGDATAWILDSDGRAQLSVLNVQGQSGSDWLVSAGVPDGGRLVMEGSLRLWPGRITEARNWADTLQIQAEAQ